MTATVRFSPTRRLRRLFWLLPILLASLVLARPLEVSLRTVDMVAGPEFTAIPPQGHPHDLAVVFLSGDAGFNRGSGPEIARRLARRGYPVLGIDSLRYFAQPRTAADDAALVESGVQRALAWTHASRFAVVGESFGADMAPSAVERFPPDLRARLAMVALVVPTRTVDFHISLWEWLGWARPDADAAAVAQRLGATPLLCIGGMREPDSLCPRLHTLGLTAITLPGNHYLDHDYDRTAATLAAGFQRALSRPSSGGAAPAAQRSAPR